MRWEKARIGIRGIGPSEENGRVAVCQDCGSRTWVLFRVGGHADLHVQCVGCGAVFCAHDSDCNVLTTYQTVPAAEATEGSSQGDGRR